MNMMKGGGDERTNYKGNTYLDGNSLCAFRNRQPKQGRKMVGYNGNVRLWWIDSFITINLTWIPAALIAVAAKEGKHE